MLRKCAGLALAVSLGLAASLPGSGAPKQATAPLEEGRALLLEATDGFYNQSLTSLDVARLLDASREVFSVLPDAVSRSYWQARADFLHGIVERENKNPRAAEQRFGASLRLLSSYVDWCPSSDVWRLMADNYAQLTMALYLANAPAIAGGSTERALVRLQSLRERDDLESEDRFAVRLWLGMIYGKKGDHAAAKRYLQEAQAVYPGNTWIVELQDRYG